MRDLLRGAIDPGWEIKLHAAERDVKKKKDKKDKKMKKDKKDKKEKKKYVLGEPVIPMTIPPTSMIDSEDEVSQDPETVRNTIRNGSIDVGKNEILAHTPESTAHGSPRSSSSKSPKKSVSFDDHTEEILDHDKKKGDVNSISSSDSSIIDSSSSSSSDTTASSDNDAGDTERARTPMAQQRPLIHSSRPIQPIDNRRIRVRTASGTTYECDRLCPHKGVDLSAWGQVRGDTLVCTKHSWTFPLEGGGVGTGGRSVNPCQVNDW